MVTVKPWKLEAIVRLVLSVILCMFAGSLVLSTMHYARTHKSVSPWYFVLVAVSLVLLGWALVSLRKWRVGEMRPHRGAPQVGSESIAEKSEDNVPARPSPPPWGEGQTMSVPGQAGPAGFRGSLESWSLWRLLVLGITFYGGLVLSFWAESIAGPLPSGMTSSQVIISGLSLQGAALVLLVFFVREHGIRFSEAFGFRNHLGRAVMFGVLAACLVLPVARVLLGVSMVLMKHFHLEPKPQSAVEALRISNSLGYRLSLAIYAILLAPAAEEMIFRGVFYPAIKQAGFPRLAWVGTAILFAAIHLNLPSFLPLLLLAFVLTFLYETTNNLAASITAHALFNIINFALFYVPQWMNSN